MNATARPAEPPLSEVDRSWSELEEAGRRLLADGSGSTFKPLAKPTTATSSVDSSWSEPHGIEIVRQPAVAPTAPQPPAPKPAPPVASPSKPPAAATWSIPKPRPPRGTPSTFPPFKSLRLPPPKPEPKRAAILPLRAPAEPPPAPAIDTAARALVEWHEIDAELIVLDDAGAPEAVFAGLGPRGDATPVPSLAGASRKPDNDSTMIVRPLSLIVPYAPRTERPTTRSRRPWILCGAAALAVAIASVWFALRPSAEAPPAPALAAAPAAVPEPRPIEAPPKAVAAKPPVATAPKHPARVTPKVAPAPAVKQVTRPVVKASPAKAIAPAKAKVALADPKVAAHPPAKVSKPAGKTAPVASHPAAGDPKTAPKKRKPVETHESRIARSPAATGDTPRRTRTP